MEKESSIKANIVREPSELGKKIKAIIKGCAFSIIFSIIILTIYAMILVNTNISEATIPTVILTITGVSILLGGTISARKIKRNGLIYGGIVGIVYVLTLYLASSISIAGFSLSIYSFAMLGVGIVTGIIGGIIGVNMAVKEK